MELKYSQYFALIFLVFTATESFGEKSESSEVTAYFLKQLNSKNYDPRVKPDGVNGPDSPVEVHVSAYVLDIEKVDDTNMEFRANFYFRQSWNDSRLKFRPVAPDSSIILSQKTPLWTPDLFFVEEREGKLQDIVQPNVFLRVKPNGNVKYSVRVNELFNCPMDFHKFPHDVQTCTISIESYGFKRESISLKWDTYSANPFGVSEEVNPNNFELIEHRISASNLTFNFGNYSRLQVDFLFKRKSGFFWTRLYIPSLILSMLSLGSFWIPPNERCLRLSLLMLILYLMVSVASKANKMVPPVSYTKGSDVWIAFNESFIFAAILEFIIVCLVKKKDTVGDVNNELLEANPKASSLEKSFDRLVGIFSALKGNQHSRAERIDVVFRILFPIVFILFNIVYWSVYNFDIVYS